MNSYAMVENRRNSSSAAFQSAKRRKNYRPVSAATRSAWASPKVAAKKTNGDLDMIEETPCKIIPMPIPEPEPEEVIKATPVKSEIEPEVEKPQKSPLNEEQILIEEHQKYISKRNTVEKQRIGRT